MIPLSVPDLAGNELGYVTQAIQSGWISSRGPYVELFERRFGEFVGRPAATCTSGTAALHLALLAAGIGPGDEVIVPDLTFAATAAAVKHVGATPVLVDVDENWLLSVDAANGAITPRTKAIIPVHLYGVTQSMLSFRKLAEASQLILIEDCAESLGEPCGELSHYACFSFYANKAMTSGEGGMVCSDEAMLTRVRLYRDGGFRRAGEYFHEVAGLNYRMTNITAAIGVAQLERFDALYGRRRAVVARYGQRLKGRGSWFYVIEVDRPREAARKLAEAGIETRPVFYPLHLQPPFQQAGNFRNAERAYERGLCLPTGPHLTDEQIDYICEQVERL